MYIERVNISNFKSFSNLDIHFNNLNLFVGANASGKSNFINIFEFLRNIAQHGLDNAISIEGGVEYLQNLKLGASQDLAISITYKPNQPNFLHRLPGQKFIGSKTVQAEYSFRLKFYHRGHGFRIINDRLNFQYEFVSVTVSENKIEEKEVIGTGAGTLFVNNNQIVKSEVQIPDGLGITHDDLLPTSFPRDAKLEKKMLLLETPFFDLAHRYRSPFENLAIYDFDSKLPKRATSIAGLKELEENGSNLAIVLKSIIEDKENKRKFLNLLNDLLSFVDDFKVQRLADKSILFMMSEEYNKPGIYIPATSISDGTINLIALIIAMYFEEKAPIIFEEPERNIHPNLISRLVNMFNDISGKKQVIVTTHNPEIVRNANIDTLFLVARDSKGFSTISRPANNNAVQSFLENEIGIDELYVQDLLGITDAE